LQAAFYSDVWHWATGETLKGYGFLAVEDQPPHGVKLHVLSDEWTARGRRLYRENLNTYARCTEADEWPAYDDKASVLDMPGWLAYEEDNAAVEEDDNE
jgi:exodeoxyribonuclease VIII